MTIEEKILLKLSDGNHWKVDALRSHIFTDLSVARFAGLNVVLRKLESEGLIKFISGKRGDLIIQLKQL